MDHCFVWQEEEKLYRCTQCGLLMKVVTFGTSRFGLDLEHCQNLPVYARERIPNTLANKTWFNQKSLEAVGDPVAYYVNPNFNYPAYIPLYPKNKVTTKAKKRPSDGTYRRALRAMGVVVEKEKP